MNSTYTPVISAAVLTPNPAVAGASVIIYVSAADIEAIPSVVDYRSGEFQAGEV